MDELFSIIGKLYVDVYNAQKYMESVHNKLKEKEAEIMSLKNKTNNQLGSQDNE